MNRKIILFFFFFSILTGADFGFTHDGNLYFSEGFGGHRWITLMKLSGEYHLWSWQPKMNSGMSRSLA